MYRTHASPLVYRSTLFGVDALDPLSGESRWSWATGMQHVGGELPVHVRVDRDMVLFLGTLARDQQHFRALVCLDASRGALRWIHNLEPLYPAAQCQILLVACGEVLVLTGSAPYPITVGISRADGRRLWARQEPYPARPVLSVEGHSESCDRA